MRYKEPGWVELACPDGRRGVWMRVTDQTVELCAGREGDDAYVEFRLATLVIPEQLAMAQEILENLEFAKRVRALRKVKLMPAEVMSIIEVARRLQDPDLCPVCRQDWRQASCSHQVLYLDGLCSEDIDALCGNVEYFYACDTFLKELVRCLRKQFPV